MPRPGHWCASASVQGRRSPAAPRLHETRQSTPVRPLWPALPSSHCARMQGHDPPNVELTSAAVAFLAASGRAQRQAQAQSRNAICTISGRSVVALSAGMAASLAATRGRASSWFKYATHETAKRVASHRARLPLQSRAQTHCQRGQPKLGNHSYTSLSGSFWDVVPAHGTG